MLPAAAWYFIVLGCHFCAAAQNDTQEIEMTSERKSYFD